MRGTKRKKDEWKIRPPSNEVKDPEMAAHYVTERFPVVPTTHNVGEVFDYIQSGTNEFQVIDYVYAVNTRNELEGVLSMRDLFGHSDKTPIKSIMRRDIVQVSPETPIQAVAKLALQHHLRGIPVVKNRKLEGVIQTHEILHIVNRSLHEKLLQFSGVTRDTLNYDDTMKVPLWDSLIHRTPWLLIGLLGVIITAGIVDHFESLLDKHLILAFFIPAIVYMSDALGTQNQTLLIRDMATMGKGLQILPYAIKTMVIALIISGFIGILVFGVTTTIWGDPHVALVIAIAMAATLIVSGFTSIATTFLFQKLGQDPALGSGPFATIISDMTSIILYFIIVSVLL